MRDLTMQKFRRLLAVMPYGRDKYRDPKWLTVCDCGNVKVVLSRSLVTGHTISCGCWKDEEFVKQVTVHGDALDGQRSPTYRSWQAMRSRCYDPNAAGWKHYGGASVTYDPAWDDFTVFKAQMGERPPGTTLGRFLDTGNYKKSNCSWMTWKEQREQARLKRLMKQATFADSMKGETWQHPN